MNQPIISIITVTYNNLNGLKKTVENISQLPQSNIEHIIVDGKSTDGSVDYLYNIDLKHTLWTSEEDKGIYDAMNKGIKLCKGNWLIFMNAGDIFNSSKILEDVTLPEEPAVLYGNCLIDYETGFSRLMSAKPLNSFWKGLPFSHQTVIMHKSFLKTGFELSYRYCADYALIYKLFLEQIPFINTHKEIANISAGGVSDNKRYLATAEVYKIGKNLNSKIKLHFYFIPKIISSFFIVKFKSILPKNWQNKLYKVKYK